MTFVPAGFVRPAPLRTDLLRLALLGPEHNRSDHAAWSANVGFIHRLPGWEMSTWPRPMAIEENLRDLVTHRARSTAGLDFAYTVLLPDGDDVVGCVYFKPTTPPRVGAVDVRSWVTAEHAELDKPLYDGVTRWLAEHWPWSEVRYAPRP